MSERDSGGNIEGSPSLQVRLVAGDLSFFCFFLLVDFVGVSSPDPARMGAQQLHSSTIPKQYAKMRRMTRDVAGRGPPVMSQKPTTDKA